MVMVEQFRRRYAPRTAERVSGASRIVEAVECCIRKSGYPSLVNVRFDYHEGVLVLRGELPSYYLKQVAQTAVSQVDGVQQVDNRIEVSSPRSGIPR